MRETWRHWSLESDVRTRVGRGDGMAIGRVATGAARNGVAAVGTIVMFIDGHPLSRFASRALVARGAGSVLAGYPRGDRPGK